MGLLRQLSRVAGLALGRTAERLLRWAGERRGEETWAEGDAPPADSLGDGPPAHWLATVRAKAPWLLARQPSSHRIVVLRPAVPVALSGPEQTPSEGRRTRVDSNAVNVVYKEGDARNATPNREVRTPSERVRLRAPPPRLALDQGLKRSTGAGSEVDRRPEYRAAPAGEKSPGERLPNSGPSARLPVLDSSRELDLSVSPVIVPLTAPAASNEPPRAVTTRPQPPAAGLTPRAFQSGSSQARPSHPRPRQAVTTGPPHQRPAAPAMAEGTTRPATRFQPVLWGEREPQHPVQPVSPAGDSESAEDPWPQLPEWGWQQWQMDPIQRQFREWDRRARLKAEQAGSSWSGPHS